MEAEERAILESCREEAGLLSPQDHANALHARPFLNSEPPPAAPNYGGAEIVFRETAHDQARTALPRTAASRYGGVSAGVMASIALGAALTGLQTTTALVLAASIGGGFLVAALVNRVAKTRWERNIQAAAEERISAECPP